MASLSTEDVKRTYVYAHRLTQHLELECRAGFAATWVEMNNAQLRSLGMGDDDLAFSAVRSRVIQGWRRVARRFEFWS